MAMAIDPRYTYFWHSGAPLAVKFEIEKAVRALLTRHAGDAGHLVFIGSVSVDPTYHAQLRFEAAAPERNLYSLRMDVSMSSSKGAGNARQQWFTPERLAQDADRTFARWIANLENATPGTPDAFSGELYARIMSDAIAEETRLAAQREDEGPIVAARQAVLEAFRSGKRCCSADKEGHTTFYFDGRSFVREHTGDWDERQKFANGDELLADLRKFYHWDIVRDTFPHSPPEIEAWTLIQSKLRSR
jgi:hypothetical protein